MVEAVANGLIFLSVQSGVGLVALFWFTILFEIPHYTLAFAATLFASATRPRRQSNNDFRPSISIVIAGHNEADAIERCVLSLREQSRPPEEIIVVSDGSRDAMPDRLRELQSRGLIDQAHCTELRNGKAAGVNLGERFATGDIVVVVDCDCSYDRHAIRQVTSYFENPAVGSVSGNIQVRNPHETLVSSFQAIEYLISISLGKQAAELVDHVVCVSGAFSAFRRSALADVHGMDAGSGEDLDLTLRLRKAGWKIHFAEDAICYTDVPTSLAALVRQRFRWERDAVRLRYRKHGELMNPFDDGLKLNEVLHQLEFIVFNVIGSAVMPFYILWLFTSYGDIALLILLAAQAGLLVLDVVSFMLASLATPRSNSLSLLPYVAGYSLFNGLFMRFVRLAAYLQEWIFNASVRDTYVPEKVQILRKW